MLDVFKRRVHPAPRAQCARCGIVAKADTVGRRTRFKIDAFAWSSRCKAVRADPGLRSPFDCPDLKAAINALGARDSSAPT